jgi:hypothetical protein
MKLNLTPGLIFAGAVMVVTPFRVQADQWDKKTIITVDQPIQVTNTYLEPGTYVFKLVNSSSNRNIVQIFNRDQNHLINTVMAIPNYRLELAGNTVLTFWETPAGTAKAVRAWFYPGDNFGQEFRYPTNLRQLAAVSVPVPRPYIQEPLPAQESESKVETVSPQRAEERAELRAEEPGEVEASRREAPIEIAQNTPPPAPPEPAVAPAPPPAEYQQPQELPKTASPYSIFGLIGGLAAGMFTLLRVRRLS